MTENQHLTDADALGPPHTTATDREIWSCIAHLDRLANGDWISHNLARATIRASLPENRADADLLLDSLRRLIGRLSARGAQIRDMMGDPDE
ncbi:hypothetical protein HKCCSP123_06165 [Rhodobacterales bacterium HKCCSP123]|nr:hypothetical protein [Rhodobacterales bacterium HKCCSP123]